MNRKMIHFSQFLYLYNSINIDIEVLSNEMDITVHNLSIPVPINWSIKNLTKISFDS